MPQKQSNPVESPAHKRRLALMKLLAARKVELPFGTSVRLSALPNPHPFGIRPKVGISVPRLLNELL
jgi:hypothetical protein